MPGFNIDHFRRRILLQPRAPSLSPTLTHTQQDIAPTPHPPRDPCPRPVDRLHSMAAPHLVNGSTEAPHVEPSPRGSPSLARRQPHGRKRRKLGLSNDFGSQLRPAGRPSDRDGEASSIFAEVTHSQKKSRIGKSPLDSCLVLGKKKNKKDRKNRRRKNDALSWSSIKAEFAAGRHLNVEAIACDSVVEEKAIGKCRKREERNLLEWVERDLKLSQACEAGTQIDKDRCRSDGGHSGRDYALNYMNGSAVNLSFVQDGEAQKGPTDHGNEDSWRKRKLLQEEKVVQYVLKRSVALDNSPATGFQTTRTVVLAWGKRIPVIVTKEASVVQRWIRGQNGNKLFGLDLEWRPNRVKGSRNKVALLQLCGANECLIVQMLFLDRIPNALADFLRDPSLTLAGVGIESDIQKLKLDHGLPCEGVVELTSTAVEQLNRDDLKHVGLKVLVQEVLGLCMRKPKTITMSNWAKLILDRAQVEYACIDAWVSFALISKLITVKA